jgi:hypothetical protein
MASEILSNIINTAMIFQYVNVVLMMKQGYHLLENTSSEAAISYDGTFSTRMDKEHSKSIRNINSKQTFSIKTFNCKSATNSSNVFTIRDIRVICSELYDAMHTNNKSFKILILLDVITMLTNTVPNTYFGFMTLKLAIIENGPFQLYLKGLYTILLGAFFLLSLLWLAMCCQKTTEGVGNIFIGIQRLLLYPSTLGWSTSEIKSFSSQMKNNKVEFIIYGFFTLNLQFFCASVSVIFTYILVLHQLS